MGQVTLSKGMQALVDAHTMNTSESGSDFVKRAIMEAIDRDKRKKRKAKVAKAVGVRTTFRPQIIK